MSSNRNIRNPQQLRSLIQNMGRSIDEARSRRLGPPSSPAQNAPAPADMRFEQASTPAAQPRPDAVRPGEPGNTPASPSGAPPVRGANEMFDGGTPRLKARPKRAS